MATQPVSIKIVVEDGEFKTRAEELSNRLGLDRDYNSHDASIVLFVSTQGLSIAASNDTDSRVYINFSTGKSAHRRKFGGGVHQTIARAVGLNKNKNLKIIDATGGLARDAFVLASLGAELNILEQSPILCVLIEDALNAGARDPDIAAIIQRMNIQNCNSVDALCGVRLWKYADVVYMDPMYPNRQKNAAVKKDMQLLHLLIGPDSRAEDLLGSAMSAARKRVVVKRPTKAPPLSTHRLAGNVASKNTRYDIYTPYD